MLNQRKRHGRTRHPKRPSPAAARIRQAAYVIDLLERRTLLSSAPPTPLLPTPKSPSVAAAPLELGPAQLSSPIGAGYTPAQMVQAYGYNKIMFGSVPGQGQGQTIAIIDSNNDPDAAGDLSAFSSYYDLPQMNRPGGPTFNVVNQYGQPSPLPPDASLVSSLSTYGEEISLDIEWAHAMAPRANIILFEANSPNLNTDYGIAVATAADTPGVSVVSMSYVFPEYPAGPGYVGSQSFDSLFTTPTGHNGVTFVAATGDEGAPGSYPAYSPNVVAAGGTTISVESDGDYEGEVGWTGSGGGVSQFEAQPAYQNGVVTQSSTNRTIPDVSMEADISSGVSFYDSYDFGTSTPWGQGAGTSLATPMFAALVAIADQGRALHGAGTLDGPTQTLPDLYTLSITSPSDFHDITTGNNSYAAGPGYDLVTGIGSPVAQNLVASLAAPTGPADILRYSQLPTDTTVGDHISPVVVDVDDVNGNLEAANTSAVTMSIASGPTGAVLGGTVTVHAVDGVATFSNLTLSKPGTYTLRASDSSLIKATTQSFTAAGPAVQLAFIDQPQATTAGATIYGSPTTAPVTVAIEDAEGNTVTSDDSDVTLSLAADPFAARLSGTLTAAAVDGIATFSNLAVSAAGQYRVLATDGKLSPTSSAPFTVLGDYALTDVAQFDYNNGATSDGSDPQSGLIMDSHGNLFGTTYLGGDADEDGTIFEIAAGSDTVTTLALFDGTDGSQPQSTLTIDSHGNLYGNTEFGGVNGLGAIFELPAGSHTIVDLTSFDGINGAYPGNTKLVMDGHGNLYGTTQFGGSTWGMGSDDLQAFSGWGTVFELRAGSGTIIDLAQFNGADGLQPFGSLTLDSRGNLFGTTVGGGVAANTNAGGTIFELAAGSGKITDLVNFTGLNGGSPEGPLLVDSRGDLFGTSFTGDGNGNVFELPAGSSTISVLASFDGAAQGELPFTSLLMDSAGNLYGTAEGAGDVNDDGTVFAVPFGSHTVVPLSLFNFTDGSEPFGDLVAGPDGSIYGVTQTGGATGDGVVFEIAPVGTPAQLAITRQPTTAVAGKTLSPFTVDVEDANGNLVTSDDSEITLSIFSGPNDATLYGTTTVQTQNGVATFKDLSLDIAGSYTLKASDGLLTWAISDPITITPAAAAELAFIQPPTNTAAGSVITPAVTVAVEDIFGNVVTGNTSAVTLFLAGVPTGAKLSGTATVHAVAGIAAFSNLSISKAGKYALVATDEFLAPAVSSFFTVTADPMMQMDSVLAPLTPDITPAAALLDA